MAKARLRDVYLFFHTAFLNPNHPTNASTIESVGQDYDAKSLSRRGQAQKVLLTVIAAGEKVDKLIESNEAREREHGPLPEGPGGNSVLYERCRERCNHYRILLAAQRDYDAELQALEELQKAQKSFDYCGLHVRERRHNNELHIKKTERRLAEFVRTMTELRKRPAANPNKAPYSPPRDEDKDEARESAKRGVTEHPFVEDGTQGLLGNWTSAGYIGGGMAAAALWLDLDEQGRIRQRVVRKDTYFSANALSDATRWKGDPKVPSEREPLEWYCQRTVQGCQGAKNVVQALGCKVDLDRLRYRLYTAWCPFGDTEELIYRADKQGEIVPEAFLWMVFSALVDCGMIMEHGNTDSVARADGKQIVHRDLKPQNVFLDLADTSSWPRYAQPKLGDFGLAFETSEDDPLNPLIWNRGGGTLGFLPPEQRSYIDRRTREPVDAFKLLAHTNVWGVGAIMWSFVHGGQPHPDWQPDYLPGGKMTYGISDKAKKAYSDELLECIEECLSFNPAERPSFAELRESIEGVLEDGEDDDGSMSTYMRWAKDGVQVERPAEELTGLKSEMYKIGMTLPSPAQQRQSGGGGQAEEDSEAESTDIIMGSG
ncbi:hypothetical protein LTR37_011278 [Vermiconidia calcicola]|uniref:Uncharacterized protein n=1 Tax=Vermiconidia calcicola TaxID=1690605 RepID=A0ACC3N2L5_9PEZI|nr:hypothetical protein LTR37_011278 [Vermiconidia calcicola]